MKTQILIVKATLVLGMAVFGLGCSKGSSGFSAGDNGTTTGGTTGSTGGGTTGATSGLGGRDTDAERGAEWQAGGIAALNADWNGWTYYAATHPLNSPTDLKVSIKLNAASITQKPGSGGDTNNATGTAETFTAYSGKVLVSYYDNGQYYTGRFETGAGKVASGVSHGHGGKYHSGYNRWFVKDGKNVFHGFFEDQYGAILLVIDNSASQGDGQSSALTGQIWVRNYSVSGARPNDNGLPCWFVELGPYDCRTFLTSSEILSTTSALTPDQSAHAGGGWYPTYNQTSPARGWKLLGTFQGLDRARAGL